jgi:vacuolar-type H+-ATPase subunit H
MDDTFKEIREVEKASEEIISGAEAKKAQMIAAAKKEAERVFSQNAEAMKKHVEEETEKMSKEAESARQKVLNASRKKIDALRQVAQENSETVVEKVLRKFEGLFE